MISGVRLSFHRSSTSRKGVRTASDTNNADGDANGSVERFGKFDHAGDKIGSDELRMALVRAMPGTRFISIPMIILSWLQASPARTAR